MDKKNIVIVVLSLALVALLSGGGVYLWQQSNTGDAVSTEVSKQIMVDENSSKPTETYMSEPLTDVVDDEGQITKALALRHSRNENEVELSIDEKTDEHAKGSVKFTGDIGGGWWLAAKVDSKWVVVADGNGTVMCSDIEPYNFPISMVPECWDETAQALITR